MALWGSRLHVWPGMPPAHLSNGLQAPSASCRPQAQCLVSMTPSKRSYTPLVYDGCRGWGGGATPSVLLHSRENNTKKKKEEKKFPEQLLFIESTNSQLFRAVEMGRGTVQLRKHGSMTGQEATSPLPAFLAAGHQRAGVAVAVTKPPPARFTSPVDAAPLSGQGPLKEI